MKLFGAVFVAFLAVWTALRPILVGGRLWQRRFSRPGACSRGRQSVGQRGFSGYPPRRRGLAGVAAANAMAAWSPASDPGSGYGPRLSPRQSARAFMLTPFSSADMATLMATATDRAAGSARTSRTPTAVNPPGAAARRDQSVFRRASRRTRDRRPKPRGFELSITTRPLERRAPPPPADASYYLIAFKDHTIYSAVAYYTEGDTLHYFTSGNVHNQVSLSLVDRQLTEQLNRDRNMAVRLP